MGPGMKYDQDNRQDHDSDLNPFNDPDLQQFDKHLDEEEARIRDEEEEIKSLDDKFNSPAHGEESIDSEQLSDAEESDDDDDDDDDDETEALTQPTAGGEQDLFNPSGGGNASGGGFIKKQGTKMLVAVGVSGLILVCGSIFGFLNTFRLKHLMENINFHAFNRYNAAIERRSDKWVAAYTKVRMLEFGDGENQRNIDGNLYFRANKVDTNGFTDWYRTMRTSSFEDDLLKNQGIRFTSSIDSNGRIRPAVINIKGNENTIVPNAQGEFSVLGDVNGPQLDALTKDLDAGLVKVFDDGTGGNKAARLAIRDAVNKETHKWQVIKRRHTRKAIANMTGVRDWRFFDKTRTKVENKKNEFKSKMIKKIFPRENSRAGNFLLCALGLGGCSATTDSSNPDNKKGSFDPNTRADVGDTGEQAIDPETGEPMVDPETGKPVLVQVDGTDIGNSDRAARVAAGEIADQAIEEGEDLTEKKFNQELIQKITKQFTEAIGGGPPGWAQVKKVLDWALKFNNNLKRNPVTGRSKIGDAIYMARLTGGLMMAYATISTITDQMQSGEVDPDQVNAAMEYFNDAGNSEAFNFIFSGETFPEGLEQTRTNADGTTEQVDKCSTGESFTSSDLVPFCSNLKPNGGSRLSTLEDVWNRYVSDSPLGTIINAYKEAKDNVVFSVLDKVGDFFGDIASKVIQPILSALGLDDAIASVVGWLSEKLLAFIGVKPCMTGAEDSGAMAVNCLVGGAAGSAETAAREAGGILVDFSDAAYTYSKELAVQYNKDTYDSMNTYDKYLALDNHKSLASNLLFGFTLSNNPLSNISNMFSLNKNFSKGFSGLGSLISGKALAASEDEGFRDTCGFSGVDCYAITQECVENNPLSPDYLQNATNSTTVSRDWDTLSSAEKYSSALYSENGDSLDEQQIENIYHTYNCAALDNIVKGGLGYTRGYSKDDGYSSSGDSSSLTNTIGSFQAGISPDWAGRENDPCPVGGPGSVVDTAKGKVRLCDVHGYKINVVMAGAFESLYNDMATAGFTVPGGNNFRTFEEQTRMHNESPDSTAPPGKSNHEFGLAVDTECAGPNGGSPFVPWMGGKSRGLPEFQKAITEHPCLNWLHTNSSRYGLLLQCNGRGKNGGEISADRGGCESWHLSPTGG